MSININININIDFGCAESDCRFMAGRDPTANLRGRPLSAYELSYDALELRFIPAVSIRSSRHSRLA
jgi:hypothetical protein